MTTPDGRRRRRRRRTKQRKWENGVGRWDRRTYRRGGEVVVLPLPPSLPQCILPCVCRTERGPITPVTDVHCPAIVGEKRVTLPAADMAKKEVQAYCFPIYCSKYRRKHSRYIRSIPLSPSKERGETNRGGSEGAIE